MTITIRVTGVENEYTVAVGTYAKEPSIFIFTHAKDAGNFVKDQLLLDSIDPPVHACDLENQPPCGVPCSLVDQD